MIRVVLVDDQELVRSRFAAIIDAHDDLEVVGEARDGAESLNLIERTRPDVVLMDIRMPGTYGITATRALVARGDPCRILVLTTFDHDDYVCEALTAGASGFLLKDMPRHRVIDAIRLVRAGDALVAPSLIRQLIEAYIRRPRATATTARLARLSIRETEVLRLVAAGCSNAEFASALFIAETTVKSHVAPVLTKLNVRDRVQAVVLAYESGLVRPNEATTAPAGDW